MACISSSVNCEACGSSPFDSTPPVAQILIRSAPYLMFCRTWCCTCAMPSATPSPTTWYWIGNRFSSQCPPVIPSNGPLTCMCGPGTCPALIASRRSTSTNPLAPTLRTEVKPAISVVRAFTTPLIASFADVDINSLYGSKSGFIVRCVCTSISPGITVIPPRSTTTSPGAGDH